ncbi:hypothetical protein TELCIR_07815 [Teladorsagia circumcincta]|uniref:Uncharacterized protein n=1 Tax=Teladorsagia circumcincta TaxID=45464 RepID=A0A2G9UJC6_TELCI|nr:hypothetical protein TELCIR_07815 [Teladorsagia circumcincta]
MTKLGITPGVHGDGTDEKTGDTVTDTVKVDPKVFTVLQPTVIPIQTPPAVKPRRSIGSAILRGVLLFLLFISCFTAGMVLIYGADTIFNGIYGAIKGDQSAVATTVAPPEQFGLVNPMGNDLKDGKPAADDEMKVFFNSIPLAKVMVIEGGNTPDVNGQQKAMNERPMHPYEQQEIPYDAYNNRPAMPPPMWVLQAKQMERAQAIRQWRWRRLQQAIYEQQMMREAMARAEWAQAEQQQRAAQEEQLARAIAQARWEQVQRARAMEEYQAEVLTRPHDASPAQILSMQQPTVPPAPEMGMHDKIYQEMQVEGENMFRDILSVFDEAEKKVENVIDLPADTIFKTIEEQKPEPESVFKTVEEQKPEPENVFKTVEEQKPEEAQIPEEDSEGPVGPVVIEDRFPRIGARTTVPVESTTPVADVESDEDMEHDPLAAFLRYFEQEAQKIRGPPKTAIVDSEVRKEDPKTEQPAAVDVPEPHFQEFQNAPRLIVD